MEHSRWEEGGGIRRPPWITQLTLFWSRKSEIAQEERNLEGLVRRQNVFPNSSVLQRSFIFATINHSRNLGRARYEQLASVESTVLRATRRKSGGFNHRLPSHPPPASHISTVHARAAKSLNHRTQSEAAHELKQNGGTVGFQDISGAWIWRDCLVFRMDRFRS